MDGITSCSRGSGPWLPAALQLHVFSLLPPNDRPLSGRLVSPDATSSLSGPENCTASLSQPLPPHAMAWAVDAGQQHVRQLPFEHKLQLMCTAAASGSEVNLEVALALLQPSIFSELPHIWDSGAHPGGAAVQAGHPQLLGWLSSHCPKAVYPVSVLETAARHCTLAELQATWESLQAHPNFSRSIAAQGSITSALDAAAESVTPDAVAKVEWVLATAGSSCRIGHSTAQAAARSGDVARLRWLQGRGFPVGDWAVLLNALRHADLAVAQWLVDEAGCGLPAAGGGGEVAAEEGDRTWTELLRAAAESPDAGAKWRWLQQRGGPSVADAEPGLVKELALAALGAGQVEAVQYLLSVLGADKVLAVGRDALSEAAGQAGSIPVVECLRQAGLVLSRKAYRGAAGKLPFVRWLALEAELSANDFTCTDLGHVITLWPDGTPAHNRELLEAVQLLAGAGFSDWGRDHAGTGLIDFAAQRGDLDLVLYLRRQGAPLNADIYLIQLAAGAGCVALLEFLAALPDCFKPSADLDSTPYVAAARHGDRATLDALRRLGVPWCLENEVAEAVKNLCGEPALRWLVENGAPVGSAEDMEWAVAKGVEFGVLGAEAAAWLRGLAAGGSGAGVSDGEE